MSEAGLAREGRRNIETLGDIADWVECRIYCTLVCGRLVALCKKGVTHGA